MPAERTTAVKVWGCTWPELSAARHEPFTGPDLGAYNAYQYAVHDQENFTVIQLITPDARTGSNRALLEDGLESPAIIEKAEPYGRSPFIHLANSRVEHVSNLLTPNQYPGAQSYTKACLLPAYGGR